MCAEVGALVVVQDLTSDRGRLLNGSLGFVSELLPARGRVGVVIFSNPPPPKYTKRHAVALLPANLVVQDSAKALIMRPPGNAENADDPSKVEIAPYDFGCPTGEWGGEAAEMQDLQRQLGWRKPRFSDQTFYSKYSSYPDLFAYYDADSKGPAFPLVAPMHPSLAGVRGSVVILRVEPPRTRDVFSSAQGGGPHVSEHTNTCLWTAEVGVSELRESLAFFRGTSFRDVDQPRAMNRMMGMT